MDSVAPPFAAEARRKDTSVLDAWGRFYSGVERRVVRGILDNAWLRGRLGKSRREPVDGRILDGELAAMLALDDLNHRSDLRKLSPERARKRVAADIRVINVAPTTHVPHEDRSIPGPVGSIALRVFTPPGVATSSCGVVYLHGGGWVTGSIDTHDDVCKRLALGAACRVVSVEYRLAPEHRFPCAVDDVLAATRFVLAHAEEFGLDPTRVAVAGDSAGGNLSAVLARRTRGDARRPALQVLLYPALDGTFALASHRTFAEHYFLTAGMCEWFYAHYVGDGDRRHPDISPLLAADVSDVPALIYTAGLDPLRDEGHAYAERLRDAGTRVTYRELSHLVHGFVGMTGAIASCREASDDVAADVGRELRR